MKRRFIFLLAVLSLAMLVAACKTTGGQTFDNIKIKIDRNSGKIGNFSLISPESGDEVMHLPTFEWGAAEHAESYVLEVSSSPDFSQSEDSVYIKKTGITSNRFTLFSTIKEKNAYYYWRVTATNKDSSRTSETSEFYYKADEKEIEFDVNYADEWSVHEQGSNATVSVDESDFFNNGKSSLVVSFVEEDTKRGIPLSDGWIVVTHSQETEMYGVDAFYFNFYYSGDDSDVFLRVVDEDNEYWHSQIKLATNAKQTVIVKFDDFELRTKGGTTIANQVFDYNYIKYVELVFEKSFGDGVAMISDLKAVRYSDYGHLFISEFNFADVPAESVILDNYNFGTEISGGGKAITYSFSGVANENNDSGINGYGFVKFPIEKLLVNGDAFSFKLGYTGNINSGSVLIRIIEEDGDRWVYRQKISLLPEGGELVVPYMAFTLSEYHGDGSRQFYFVKQLQLGVEGVYSTGSITVSDFAVTYLEEEKEDLYRTEMTADGVIDDFNGYVNNVDMYYKWMLTDTNKDEAMAIEKELAFGTGNTCAKLGYKADMGQAAYGTYITNAKAGYDAISVWAMDRSVKKEEAVFNYLPEVTAQMIIGIYVLTGEEYDYVINGVSKYWTEYTVSFADFTLAEGYYGEITPLTSENIAAIRVGFQYFYYTQSGVPYPTYVSSNYVYIDNLKLVSAAGTSTRELQEKLVPSSEDQMVCVVADFDGDTPETLQMKGEKGYAYESIGLSSVTASGSGQSVEMQYKGNSESVAYGLSTVIDESVSANALKLLMKGDGKATVYVNIYMVYAGVSYKFRATLTSVSSEWTVYTIGFDNFVKIEGTGSIVLSRRMVKNITRITFGIVNSADTEVSRIYLDKMVLDGTVADREGGTTQNKREEYEEGSGQI